MTFLFAEPLGGRVCRRGVGAGSVRGRHCAGKERRGRREETGRSVAKVVAQFSLGDSQNVSNISTEGLVKSFLFAPSPEKFGTTDKTFFR